MYGATYYGEYYGIDHNIPLPRTNPVALSEENQAVYLEGNPDNIALSDDTQDVILS